MKSMLLFFDGLALSLPSNLAAEVIERDPILAIPLSERGLLVNFDPAATLDMDAAERLANTLIEAVERYPPYLWHGVGEILTDFHWGHGSAADATVEAFQRVLAERGLITPAATYGLYEMERGVRLLVLTLFAQTLRMQLELRGIALHLATDSVLLAHDMVGHLHDFPYNAEHLMGNYEAFAWPRELGSDDVMNPSQLASDLSDVGADLSAVPLDEVLDFRAQNGQHYRAYARALRELLAYRAQASPLEWVRIRDERTLEIRDQVADLRRISRSAFGTRTATLLVAFAGVAWTLHMGDPIGAMIAGAAAGLQAVPTSRQGVTAYSYLLRSLDLAH